MTFYNLDPMYGKLVHERSHVNQRIQYVCIIKTMFSEKYANNGGLLIELMEFFLRLV